jgi:hypothetical protein
MNRPPQLQTHQRAARVRPAEFTPAVIRVQSGGCTPGELQVISRTGGLLSLPQPLNQGSHIKLMFLTQSGPVLGEAEMLRPISWTEQPFRFVALEQDDRRRLYLMTSVKSAAGSGALDDRSRVRLEGDAAAPALDHEQQWIHKYRAAATYSKPRRVRLRRVAFAAFTAATLGLGTLFVFHIHLLK